LIELNARERATPTVDFLDPYLAFPMNYYLESHYHRKWNLVNVAGVDGITGDRVWVGYNHKSWKQAQSPEELLRRRGYKIGPGIWAGDRWDRIAVFLVTKAGS